MNAPAEQIAREIQRDGPITLARFMELALYMPGRGYYERQARIGRQGDFYTSVSVGSMFGELLAFQFAVWLEPLPQCAIIELGSHDGRLAADILGWMRQFRPALFARLDYCLIEPSPIRRDWQRQTLEPWLARVRWLDGIPSAPRSVRGVIFSNEFFDALPMHRLGWDRASQTWREWRVALDGRQFSWQLGPLSPQAACQQPLLPTELGAALPDQYTVEICPPAQEIWQAAARCLGAGKILAIDYGLTGEEWLRPERPQGTWRAYARHHAALNSLDNPGHQDLTAHVNFSALQRAGEEAGLFTEGLFRQETFLTRIFARTQAAPETFDAWTPERVRQFQTLTHPEHLGGSFRALLQSVTAL